MCVTANSPTAKTNHPLTGDAPRLGERGCLTTMNTNTAIATAAAPVKLATLNSWRAAAALELAHHVRKGGQPDTAAINSAASLHMKNTKPGPMVVAVILAETNRLLTAHKGKALPDVEKVADVRHPAWNEELALPLPTTAKGKAAGKAKAKKSKRALAK